MDAPEWGSLQTITNSLQEIPDQESSKGYKKQLCYFSPQADDFSPRQADFSIIQARS